MPALRWIALVVIGLGCGGASDVPDAKPVQEFDAPGGPVPDASLDGGTPDAAPVDSPPPVDSLLPDLL
jgi:hypothetical protein